MDHLLIQKTFISISFFSITDIGEFFVTEVSTSNYYAITKLDSTRTSLYVKKTKKFLSVLNSRRERIVKGEESKFTPFGCSLRIYLFSFYC